MESEGLDDALHMCRMIQHILSMLEGYICFALLGRQHSFAKSFHEIFYTVILSLPHIQEGQLSVSGERMCTILVNRLED